MKRRVKILAIVMAVISTTTILSACQGSGSHSKKQLVIGYVTKSATNTGMILENQGAEKAAKDLGASVKLILLGPPKDEDIAGQINVVEDMVNQKVDAICIAPCDSDAIVPAVKKANAANIPVVAVDTAINGGNVATFVATDNVKAAQLGAEWMGKALGGKGNVVMINGMLTQGTGLDRRNGFIDYLKQHYPDIKVVAQVPTQWDAESSLTGMEDAIKANKEIDGVYCAWDGATIAVIPALQQAGLLKKVKLLGFDADPNALKAMEEGLIEGDVAQYLTQIGYQGVQAAYKLAKGEKVSSRIDTGTMIVTPENAAKFITDNGLTSVMPK